MPFLLFCLPFIVAFLIIYLLLSNSINDKSLLGIILFLSIGLGIGIPSVSYFVFLNVFGSSSHISIWMEFLLFLPSILFLFYLVKKRRSGMIISNETLFASQRPYRLTLFFFFFVLAIAFSRFILESVNSPHGTWDAWAIWNMRARFFFRSGDDLVQLFNIPNIISVQHRDYPLLLPCSVARLWNYMGNENTVIPIIIGFLFTFSIFGLLVSSLSYVRSSNQGLIAGMVLMAITFFIGNGTWQTADIPFGFYILASIILYCMYEHMTEKKLSLVFLAGIMAGLSAWTKNEGLLFIFCVFFTRLFVLLYRKDFNSSFKELSMLISGILPSLLIILYFKMNFAPPNDLVSSQSLKQIIDKLCDAERYITISTSIIDIFKGYIFILIAGLIFLGFSKDENLKGCIITSSLIIGIMFSGYFLVYLITPHDLSWHLGTSLKRLFLQFLPSGLFLFFLIAAMPEEATDRQIQPVE